MLMEFGSERSSPGEGDQGVMVDQKRSDSYTVGHNHEDLPKQETSIEEPLMTDAERSMLEAVPISASSTKKEEVIRYFNVDELENAKVEMGEVIEENQRLKMSLNRILNDYRTLQMQFHNIVQKETKSSCHKINDQQEMLLEESELVSLSLGRLPSNDKTKASKPLKEEECKEEGLALGLDCKFETSNKSESTTELNLPNNPISPTNSSEVPKVEGGETWPPSKVLKTARDDGGEDEVSQHINPTKKARVCVRARCDTPTMNDGCQWRKYGQKISKGNPCPRAYYRCTVAPSCPVRKQVQRCAQDMSILITTYEGNHNHPLPLSATAMASTTSAAASMLLSGSSTSTSAGTGTCSNNNLYHHHGINYHLSHPPPSSLSSSSPSHPTITLDLTTANPNSSPPFARFASNYNNNPTRYSPSTSLNFSSSSEHNAIMAPSWNTNNNGFLSYNNRNLLSAINIGGIRSSSSSSSSSQPLENIYHSYMQRNNNNNNNNPLDTIAAATKVITSDPNFQSALAAALTSIITTQGTNQQGAGAENFGQKLKWGEMLFSGSNNNTSALLSASTSSSKANNNGCAASSLVFLPPPPPPPPSLPFSGTKSASGSPSDHNRDKTN